MPIDNSVVKRELRSLTIERNNWLFIASSQAGPRAAVFYTPWPVPRGTTWRLGLSLRYVSALGGDAPAVRRFIHPKRTRPASNRPLATAPRCLGLDAPGEDPELPSTPWRRICKAADDSGLRRQTTSRSGGITAPFAGPPDYLLRKFRSMNCTTSAVSFAVRCVAVAAVGPPPITGDGGNQPKLRRFQSCFGLASSAIAGGAPPFKYAVLLSGKANVIRRRVSV